MNSTLSQQRRLLVTASIVTFAVGTLAGFQRGEELPTARFIVGVGMAFTICSIMVDFGTPLGAGFAVLIMVSAVLWQGEDAFKLIGTRSQASTTSKKAAKLAGSKIGKQIAKQASQQDQLDRLE